MFTGFVLKILGLGFSGSGLYKSLRVRDLSFEFLLTLFWALPGPRAYAE